MTPVMNLKDSFCILFFLPRTRPKTFLQCFALEQRKYKAKLCRNVLGRKNKVQKLSLRCGVLCTKYKRQLEKNKKTKQFGKM